MPFVKGVSGNPRGGPKKGTSFSDILRELGEISDAHYEDAEEKITRKRALGLIVWRKALEEENEAMIKFLFDRVDGLATARHEFRGADGEDLFRAFGEVKDAELQKDSGLEATEL